MLYAYIDIIHCGTWTLLGYYYKHIYRYNSYTLDFLLNLSGCSTDWRFLYFCFNSCWFILNDFLIPIISNKSLPLSTGWRQLQKLQNNVLLSTSSVQFQHNFWLLGLMELTLSLLLSMMSTNFTTTLFLDPVRNW